MYSNHGFPEPMVMAYPCDDGFFVAFMDTPGAYNPKAPGSCCSGLNDRRVKPTHFRHYPTATRPPAALPGQTTIPGTNGINRPMTDADFLEIMEIGSGSSCQDVCFKSFRTILMVWTAIGFISLCIVMSLGFYYWSGIDEEEIKASFWLTGLLEYGPVLGFFVSLILLLIPCMGFFGSYKENTWLLLTFAALMIGNTGMKAYSPPRNPLLGFGATIFLILIPFVLALSSNKRMSRAI